MSFAWAEYLALAEALFRARATFADEEACCRAAISRAYYAAFCTARNHARDNEGLTLPRSDRGRVHQVVINYYNQHAHRQHRVVGWNLSQLRHRRNQVDYDDPNLQRVDVVTRHALNQARQVFTVLRQLSS
jgi:hypothetical protein